MTNLPPRAAFFKRALALFALLILAGILPATATTNGLTDREIQTMLQERIDRDKLGVGIVVGIVDERGARVFGHGKMKSGGSREVDGDTLFEIGSITKVFTTLLLQDMVERGEVKLEDPIGKYLPASVKTPSYHGKQITLVDLATHTSGLPRIPFSIWYIIWHISDPYAGFREKELYKFLSHHKLKKEPGTAFEYSNLGLELLGNVLELKAGTNYESLVLQRICEPLQMNSTRITLPPELKSRFASGHDESGKPTANWSCPLPGDGGLRSSANDLLKFLSAELSLTHSSLSDTITKTQVSRHATDDNSEQVALGWIINTNTGIIWHDGGTSGYSSFIAFNKKAHNGVVVLANSDDDVNEVGQVLLGRRKYHKVIKLDPGIYDQYAGDYKRADKQHGIFVITRKGERLVSRYEHQDEFELYPESETHFFNNSIDAQITFEKNDNGTVTGLLMRQPGLKLEFIKK